MKSAVLTVAVALAIASSASAQLINVDFNSSIVGAWQPAPSTGYPAASTAAGCWNAATGAVLTSFPNLGTGLACTPSAVTMNRSSGLGGDFATDNAGTTGDAQLLLDDGQDLSAVTGALTVTFSGLANGQYDVYVYAWAPDVPTLDITTVTIDGLAAQNVGGANFSGTYVQGQHYAKGTVNIVNGTLSITADGQASSGSFGTLNGIQLVPVPEPTSLSLLALGALALIRRRR